MTHQPLPVKGYRPQSAEDVALANELKEAEERYLRILDRMVRDAAFVSGGAAPKYDGRFLALARTSMQEANMWAVRSIFQPTRISLPGDPEPGSTTEVK